jgi:SAM-dependent methyltransferase
MLLFDVGCGEGAFMSAAAKIGWQVIGTELTPKAAAHAHERTGLPVLSGDLSREALFRQTSCDAVTLWGILEHVPNPDALIAGCVRLLRPGGVLLLETPNPQGLFRRVSLSLVRLSGKRFQQPFRQTLGAGHVVWYTTAGLRAAATHAGLEIVDIGGSRNSTRILLARWQSARPPARWIFQFATIVVNHFARPLGRANQIHAALRVPVARTSY